MAYNGDETCRRNHNRSWWQQRTSMERCGIFFLIITILLIIGFIAVLALTLPIKEKKGDTRRSKPEGNKEEGVKVENLEPVCETPGCVHAASSVIKYIDPSQNPCEDFYQFACGGFLKETTIPDDKTQVNSFSVMNDLLREQVKTVIEEPAKENEPKPFTLLKKLYNICMNTTAIEADGVKMVKDVLKDLGGAPVLEGKKWNSNNFDWKESVYKFRKYGLSTDNFISFDIQVDSKNSSRRLIHLDQPVLELNREKWLKGFNDSIVKAYYEYIVDLAVMFGADREFAKYELKTMISFKTELAKISLPQEERRNDTILYNPMTIAELQKSYPSIPWLDYIVNVVALPLNITNNTVVIVAVPKYIGELEKLLKKSSKRDQANHAIFQALRSVENLLPEEFRNRQQQFETVLYGTATRTPRWTECVAVSSGTFNLAAGALYIRKYFNEDARNDAVEMVSDIRTEFIKILKAVDWMDSETKKKAVDKALAMNAQIGYADELMNDAKLEEYYSDLEINTSNYFLFMINFSLFRTNKHVKELCKPFDKNDWTQRASPITVNAFYGANENSIQFPAAILQGIFFNKDRIRSMNYGAIGSIIGHEITHGFDDEGKQYDKDGNLVDWWADETDKAFMKKAQCIIDQYGSYTVPEVGIKLNGITTQGENIADNGGIKEAYLAYNSWVERNGPEPKLPGLNYTANQIFWISAANSWCTKDRNESLKQDVLIDTHSPARYRVLVPFSNSEYFAKDFDCPVGSKMNPKHKCQVW